MSPIAATSPAATVTFTPAMVSRRLTAGSSTTAHADLAVEHLEVLAQPVQLAQVPLDRRPARRPAGPAWRARPARVR